MSETLKVKRIEAEEIVVGSGRRKVTIQADKDIAGLWIGDTSGRLSGPLVCIYDEAGQTCIGIYAAGEKKWVNLGLSLDENGRPMVQVGDGDKVGWVAFETLMAMADGNAPASRAKGRTP